MTVVDDRDATLVKFGLIQVIIVALLAFSLIKGHGNLTLFLIALLVFIYTARLWSRFSPEHLRVDLSLNRERIFAGETVQVTINAENSKVLPVWLRVAVPLASVTNGGDEVGATTREQGLLWYQSIRFSWSLTPRRRGIHRLGPPEVITGDLLGIYPRELRSSHHPQDLIVYPRLVPLRPFSHIRRDLFGSPGAKSPVEDPIYLLGTRDYQSGHPARYIHWKASARLNRLQERIFEPSSQARVLFILDVAPFAAAAATDCFEKTVTVLASLAVECDRVGYAAGLVTNGIITGNRSPQVAVGRSGHQTILILETLAGVEMSSRGPIIEDLRRIRGVHGGTSCILFVLNLEEPTEEIRALLRQKNLSVTTIYGESHGKPDQSGSCGAGTVPLDQLLLAEAHP